MQVDGLEMRAYGDKRDEGVTETVSSSSSPPTHRRLQLAEPGPVTGAVQDNDPRESVRPSAPGPTTTQVATGGRMTP
ncbi:hypothetical protein B296_00027754 [Ensete ventricosum]|uniref:Uncharacterized protein n=1 Tax=Ensete ventricosum TaxID=4639 RepID=A0A426Z6B1_ENSVE|nr:hypothetical protein B296_00027754 [Ensete ventricosum]